MAAIVLMEESEMKNLRMAAGRAARTWLIILDAFLGVTAVLGGLCLVAGWYAPPLAMLAGSPFASYLIPGLALVVLVGGGSVLAAVLVARRAAWGVAASAAAGVMILVFEAVELVVIGFTWLLAFYVAIGLLILLLAAWLWLTADVTATWPHRAAGHHPA
jgi:hypothetical protein